MARPRKNGKVRRYRRRVRNGNGGDANRQPVAQVTQNKRKGTTTVNIWLP